MTATTLTYTGATQTYTVPSGCTLLTVECWGAQGGNSGSNFGGPGSLGGKGGYAKALIPVTPGETLTVSVGGKGAYDSSGTGTTAGGWNGGGTVIKTHGGSGGGATDVRQGGTALTNRIVIAGGGGGGSADIPVPLDGGNGGGSAGSAGGSGYPQGGGGGGTQSAGGVRGNTGNGAAASAGTLGSGGAGGAYGGGGGGGLYGGGGGNDGGGGGGSGKIPASNASFIMGARPGNGQVILTPYPAPDAPALLSPANNATLDLAKDQTFTWLFSSSGVDDTQTKYDLRYSSDGGTTWTTVSATTATETKTIAANTLAAGDYQWQVRTYGKTGLVGPWSASSFFTAAELPDAPTITSPADSATIGTAAVDVTFTYTSLNAYQYQVLGDDGSGNADPDNVIVATTTVTDTASRDFNLSGLPNGQTVHIQTRVQATSGGLWSEWSDQANPVSFVPPMTPGVTVTGDSTTGTITVTWTAPTPTGSAPDTASADVYVRGGPEGTIRIAKAQAAAGSYVWETPASGVAYEFEVVATATTGATAASSWT